MHETVGDVDPVGQRERRAFVDETLRERPCHRHELEGRTRLERIRHRHVAMAVDRRPGIGVRVERRCNGHGEDATGLRIENDRGRPGRSPL